MEKGEPFAGYAIEVEVWCKVTNIDVGKRASALVLRTEPIARDVCMTTGSCKLMEPAGAVRALQVLRDYSAPVTSHVGDVFTKCSSYPARKVAISGQGTREYGGSQKTHIKRACFLGRLAAVGGRTFCTWRATRKK